MNTTNKQNRCWSYLKFTEQELSEVHRVGLSSQPFPASRLLVAKMMTSASHHDHMASTSNTTTTIKIIFRRMKIAEPATEKCMWLLIFL